MLKRFRNNGRIVKIGIENSNKSILNNKRH